MLTVLDDVKVVAQPVRASRGRAHGQVAVVALGEMQVSDVAGRSLLILYNFERQLGMVSHTDVECTVHQPGCLFGSIVPKDGFRMSSFCDVNEVQWLGCQGPVGHVVVEKDRVVQTTSGRNQDATAILRRRCLQCGVPFLLSEALRHEGFHAFRIALECRGYRPYETAFGTLVHDFTGGKPPPYKGQAVRVQ